MLLLVVGGWQLFAGPGVSRFLDAAAAASGWRQAVLAGTDVSRFSSWY